MSDIFISYAREDRDRLGPLVKALDGRGWTVFWDRKIPPGRNFDDFIEEALRDARCAIVLWSRDSIGSKWVRREAITADSRGILVPAKIDAVDPPWAFQMIQAADLTGWQGGVPHDEFDALAGSVARILGMSVGPEPAVRAPDLPPRVEPPQPRSMRVAAVVGTVGAAVAALGLLLGPKYFSSATPMHEEAPTVGATLPPVSGTAAPPKPGTSRVSLFDGLIYRYIPPTPDDGYLMGCSPGDDDCRDNEMPAHRVRIKKGFWLGETEVTQAAFEKVMAGSNPGIPRARPSL